MSTKKRVKLKNYSPQTKIGRNQDRTLTVNFHAGAGAGKSTMATFVHAFLKAHGITSEYTAEEAKDMAWEGRLDLPINDILLFGQQHNRQFRLRGKVDVIITDSPLTLSSVYRNNDNLMDALVMQEFNKYQNVNYFVVRKKKYIKKGRKENKKEATAIDQKTIDLLDNKHIPYTIVEGTVDGANQVLKDILARLNTKQLYKICKL